MTYGAARWVSVLSFALAACGGQAAGPFSVVDGTDAGSAPGSGASTPPGTQHDGGAPSSLSLVPIAKGDQVGLIAFDDANAYAAIFSPASFNGDVCSWKSRWVRVAKEGGSVTELGDAATCIFDLGATAFVLDGALYWLAHEAAASGNDEVAVLMTMPTTGGAAQRVNKYDRDFYEMGTDGASFFVIDPGTSAENYTDGAVVRFGRDGAPWVLADKQVQPRFIGVTAGSFVWATEANCSFTDCTSTTFNSIPAAGGDVHPIATRPHVGNWPMTVLDGATYYFSDNATIRRLSLDGTETTFLAVPWNSSSFISLIRLRIHGDEVLASNADSVDQYLLAEPRRYDPPFVQSAVFEIDNGYAYAQRDDALVRLGIP